MQRRRMVVKRFDPWSVLKFSFLMNLAGLAMLLLAGRVVWFAVRRLMLIETVCDQASQILDLTDCGIDGGGLFQNAVVLGLFGVVVMTGFAVFFTFLLNLISDLTGGIGMTVEDEGEPARPTPAATTPRPRLATARGRDTGARPRPVVQGRASARPSAAADPTSGPAGPLVPRPSSPPATSAGAATGAAKGVDVTDRRQEAPLFSASSNGTATTRAPKAHHAPVWRPEPARADGDPVPEGR